MRANGYGADIEFDGQTVVLHLGKMAARIAGTDTITIPAADIIAVHRRRANMVINGSMQFQVRDPSPQTLSDYGGRGIVPPDGTDAFAAYAKQGIVTDKALIVHWRKKDDATFGQMHEAIMGAVATR